MLLGLDVKDFAVIEGVSLPFGAGLTVFTGETGAGKSLVVEALGFALGERAGVDWIRPGARKMEAEARFSSASLDDAARGRFAVTGDFFAVRRELDQRGRSRAFINGHPVSVSELCAYCDGLVDFHGQHEHQTLARNAAQLELLDRFASNSALLDKTRDAWRRRQAALARLEASRLSREEKERLLDLYGFQLSEIDKAALRPGEEAEIEAALPRLKNADRLRALSSSAHELLYSGEAAAVERLGAAARAAQELAALDVSLGRPAELIAQAQSAIEEAAGELAALRDGPDADPGLLDELLSRQDKISRTIKKYGGSAEAALALAQTLKAKIADLEDSDEREEELKKTAADAEKELSALCAQLHEKRFAAAKKLSALVLSEIAPLGFGEVRFSVSVEMDESSPGPAGADRAEFLFSPNAGQPARPLKNIASGGEMSRVMLGIKAALSGADRVETLVFDEVDAGVGGVVGRLVGEKMRRISESRQVLCVTHLPQVAAWADAHFAVSKTESRGRTVVAASAVEGPARAAEIARMLGGSSQASQAGLKHAKELLRECAG
ncbi:MAG: DNA repair protein RecN [Elusimicrobiales bacterium]